MNEPLCKGVVASDVPQELKQIFLSYSGPNVCFLIPEQKPGVYIIYFPVTNQIYIGESTRVSREISNKRSGRRGNITLQAAYDTNGENTKDYALYMGPALENEEKRRQLEKACITFLGNRCMNIKGNPAAALPGEKVRPCLINVVHIREPDNELKDKYGLDYQNQQFQQGIPFIYILSHPVTKRFYIGQSSVSNVLDVIRRHKYSTNDVFYQFKDNRTTPEGELEDRSLVARTYAPIAQDCISNGTTLEFRTLENLPGFTDQQRIQREEQLINEAAKKYPGRLYNQLKVATIQRTPFQESTRAERISKKAVSLAGAITKNYNPCIMYGKWYDSFKEAATKLGFKQPATVRYKTQNPREPNCISVKAPRNKKFPNDPEIQAKLDAFFLNTDSSSLMEVEEED
jgi:hypothetical protein